MRFIKQFLIILAVSFVGEVCNHLIPLPIPASIYGIILMFAALLFRIVPLENVRDAAHFLIEIMPVMFIPAAVGLLDVWGIVAPMWIPYVCVTLITTVLVMAVSGHVTQAIIRKRGNNDHA